MTKPRASLLTLPTETLFQIISYLGSAHLKQLSLTNRSLYSLTPTYLFKTVIVYNISPFFLQTIVPKYGQYFGTLNIQGRASQEFIDQLGALLIILDDYCDRLENFNIIVLEQTPGLLEFNPPCFSQSLRKNRSKSLKLTCSAQLITFLAPIYFPSFNLDSSDLGLLIHAVIQSVFCLNHYTERYGSQITRAHLSFEGLSDVWVLELFNNCSCLQELVLERKYADDYIEITDATLDGLCALSNTLRSLSFISECDCSVTECFTLAGWKRMLCSTPNLEKLDISGLNLYFTSNLLPLIADHYKSRHLWLKQTNILNHLPFRNKHEQELMNLISICKNNLLALESSYITDAVIRCLAMYSPGLIRLCFDGDLLNNRKISLDIIELRLVNLETFRTWNLLPRKWPIGLRERFGKLKNEYNCLDDADDDYDDLEDYHNYHKDFLHDTKLRYTNVDSQIRSRSRRNSSARKHNRLNIWIILLIFFLIFYYFTTQEEVNK